MDTGFGAVSRFRRFAVEPVSRLAPSGVNRGYGVTTFWLNIFGIAWWSSGALGVAILTRDFERFSPFDVAMAVYMFLLGPVALLSGLITLMVDRK